MFIGALIPLVVLGGLVYLVVRLAAGRTAADQRDLRVRDSDLADRVSRWVEVGLLSEEQSESIQAYEMAAASTRSRGPEPAASGPTPRPVVGKTTFIGEALGYLGGILAGVGLALIIARSWNDLSHAIRLIIPALGAVFALGAGALIQPGQRSALVRLRSFLWLLSTAASALFVGVLVADVLGPHAPITVALTCSVVVAAESGLLALRHALPLQQLTFFAALPVIAGTAVAEIGSSAAVGIGVWMVGAATLAFGLRRGEPTTPLAELAGAVALLIGGLITLSTSQSWGLLFSAMSAFVLLSLALVPGPAPRLVDQLVLGIVGAIGALQIMPSAIVHFSRHAGVATGAVVLSAGVGMAIVAARRLVRLPSLVEIAGGMAMVGGAALSGVQQRGLAPIIGIITAVVLITLGTLPDRFILSVFGSLGLLINVPWAMARFFPGGNKAPLVVLVTGMVLILVSLQLIRGHNRPHLHHDLHDRDRGTHDRHHPVGGAIG